MSKLHQKNALLSHNRTFYQFMPQDMVDGRLYRTHIYDLPKYLKYEKKRFPIWAGIFSI